MEIRCELEGKKAIVYIEGRIDTTTSTMLLEYLQDVMCDVTDLLLDFNEVKYISSAGLRVLLYAQKTMDEHHGKMVIRHLNPFVKEVFDITGFSSFLNITK